MSCVALWIPRPCGCASRWNGWSASQGRGAGCCAPTIRSTPPDLEIMKRLVWMTALAVLLPSRAAPQGYDPKLFGELRWRLIGPFRGGRTVAAVGIPDQPNVFFIGVNTGGVCKPTDYARI